MQGASAMKRMMYYLSFTGLVWCLSEFGQVIVCLGLVPLGIHWQFVVDHHLLGPTFCIGLGTISTLFIERAVLNILMYMAQFMA